MLLCDDVVMQAVMKRVDWVGTILWRGIELTNG